MAVDAVDAAGGIVAGHEDQRTERDDVYWTELEVRRLGNMVAEMVQAGRYCGDSSEAEAERNLMRSRLAAMKGKALRVLHRAELHVSAGQTAWPGLDNSLTQPVNLAEEYIRTVTNYQCVLEEEEDRVQRSLKDDLDVGGVRAAAKARGAVDAGTDAAGANAVGEGIGNDADQRFEDITQLDGSELRNSVEDISYREALAREAAAAGRDELLGTGGIRQRKTIGKDNGGASASSRATGKYSKADEELMARHQPVQDELTSDLVDLVSRLKGNLTEINAKIVKDGKVIDETDEALDKNLAGISKTRENLGSFTRATSVSWWTIWALVAAVLITFVLVFGLTKIPI